MIIFRADGNPDIGLGHIMRCISIADAGQALGEDCLFIMAGNYFEDIIKEHGYGVIVLNTDYRNMLSELDRMSELIRIYRPSALFLDSYQVSSSYMHALWEHCKSVNCRLVYIDDVLSFAYPCDLLLDYNIYGPDKENEYKALYQKAHIPCPKLLLGTAYAPLRAEFQGLKKKVVKKQAENILISTGGSDPDHITLELVKCIIRENAKLQHLYFHFIIGEMNDDRLELEKLTMPWGFITLHYNVKFMQKLMSNIDLAISAAGSTLYELCATQTPTITYILADNQEPVAKGFSDRQILHCAGDIRELGEELPKYLLAEAVALADNYEERVEIAQKQCLVVDGNGARRIVEEILGMHYI